MYTIHLKNIQLHGYHGVYEAEQQTGGLFEVNISCRVVRSSSIEALDDTINYEQLFGIVKKHFETAYPLLETLAFDMAAAIRTAYPQVAAIHIFIDKCNPPIAGLQGRVGVSYDWPS
jgi:7,8-dihydroneopterin aldolase/epimerase/oxygenase